MHSKLVTALGFQNLIIFPFHKYLNFLWTAYTLGNFHKRPQKNKLFLISIYLMLFRYIRMEKSKNWIYDDVLFCKSSLSKMASVKTNKIKNQTALWKTNFLRYTTLLLGPKRFLHSEGPKNVICLWLRLGNIKRSQICTVYIRSIFLVSAKDKSHF